MEDPEELMTALHTDAELVADGRIRAIYVVRNPDKLRRFLEQTH